MRRIDERTARHLVSSFRLDDDATRELLTRRGYPVVTNGETFGLDCGLGIVTSEGETTLLRMTALVRVDPDYPPARSQVWGEA